MDQIIISNLEIFARHGVFPEENVLGQKFVISAVLFTDTRQAGLSDDLSQSIHYGEVCHEIKKLMEGHTFQLIEKTAEFLCTCLLLKFDLLQEIELELKKPWAPILLPLESVAVKIRRGWHTAYLGIGSNLGDKKAFLDQAVRELNQEEDTKVIASAKYITTEPVGEVVQDDFLNGCLEIKTLKTPMELLRTVNTIEAHASRERIIHWGPRTLDLDILFYDDCIIDSEILTIPHKELHNRMFVLEPLAELAPNKRHPILNKTVAELKEML